MSDDAMYEPQGNGTEVGMLKFLQTNEIDIQEKMMQMARYCHVECDIPFNSNRKRMMTAVKIQMNGEEIVRVVVKGAPEYVIPMCRTRLTDQMDVEEMDEDEGAVHLKKMEESYAKQ